VSFEIPEEDRLAALLAEAGPRLQPPSAQQQAWENLFRRELGTVVAARRRRRRAFYAAAAAALLLTVAVALLPNPTREPAFIVAEVVATIDGNQSFRDGDRLPALTTGSSVHVDQTVRTANGGLLALAYHGADVRLNSDTTVLFHAASIELINGSIYVDTGAQGHSALPVVVTTALGSFSHLGTQFMVTVDDAQGVTAAVRAGTINVRTSSVQRNLNATATDAEIVTISRSGAIETQRVDRYGERWSWVVSSAPGRTIDGLSADEVLSWIANETGRELKYASPQLASEARNMIRIRATSRPMNPQQALKLLPAITSLHIDDSKGVDLLVSSSEGDPDPD